MNATCSSPSSASGSGSISVSEVDASCRLPLFLLFISASVWLVVASFFGLLASTIFHKPDLFSNCAWLTYGRVHPVAMNAMLYGFAIQAGLGVGLWIIARLGQTPVSSGWVVIFGSKLWNLGVLIGLVGIFMGDSNGFENLEMPRYAAVVLFLGYVLIGMATLFTLHARRGGELQPSQWFLLAAIFWFPWIYTTANLLLTVFPVRGVMQPIVTWWYSANLNLVWLALVGLSAVFYFIPRLMNRPLHSHYLALFTFWTVILFASWSGIPSTAPVPAWMQALSTIATVLTVIPVLSVMVNVYKTVGKGCSQSTNPPPGKFLAFGVMAFVLSWMMNVVGAVPGVSPLVSLTWYTVAQSELILYGFFAMTMFGAIYYILPQVSGFEWPCPKSARAHFWLAAIGIVLIVLPLAIGGILQGIKLSDPGLPPFLTIVKGSLHSLRVSTVGELLLLIGHLLLLLNLVGMQVRYFRTHFGPFCKGAMAELTPAEVKS